MKITELTPESVAGPKNCWPGYRKTGTQPGTGKNKGKRVNDCEKIKEQGVAEGSEGSWVVYDGAKIKRFKTHEGAKAYAEKNGGKVASSEYYHDKIQQKQGVAEASLATMRDYFAGDKNAEDPTASAQQRNYFSKNDNSKPAVAKKFRSKQEYEQWLAQRKDKKAFKVTEGVIIGPSETGDPMDPQVAVLGGAGSYSLKGLYNKAQRESAQLTKDIGLGNFRSSSHNVKQLTNTLNTIVAAHNELEAIRKGGGPKSRGIERGVDYKE